MQDLDRVTLSKDADVRVLDNNFLNVKNAVDAVEDSISDESARATQKENAISANVQQNTNDIAIHTQQINDLQENLADYIGAFDNKADLDAYSGTLSNNDWAVVLDDETHSNQCWRYIYRESTTSWEPQFMVNEKPLTQAQLNAINSGIDPTKVAQIATNTTNIANKQDALVSGTNIKTINNTSILGSGNIDIRGGGGEGGKYYLYQFSVKSTPSPSTYQGGIAITTFYILSSIYHTFNGIGQNISSANELAHILPETGDLYITCLTSSASGSMYHTSYVPAIKNIIVSNKQGIVKMGKICIDLTDDKQGTQNTTPSFSGNGNILDNGSLTFVALYSL